MIKEKLPDKDPVEVFAAAIENVKPSVEVRSKRVGGANYQVPVEVSRKRQQSLAFRWILEVCRELASGRPPPPALAEELMAAFKREGGAMAKRENTHKMAEANKAFSALRLVTESSSGPRGSVRVRCFRCAACSAGTRKGARSRFGARAACRTPSRGTARSAARSAAPEAPVGSCPRRARAPRLGACSMPLRESMLCGHPKGCPRSLRARAACRTPSRGTARSAARSAAPEASVVRASGGPRPRGSDACSMFPLRGCAEGTRKGARSRFGARAACRTPSRGTARSAARSAAPETPVVRASDGPGPRGSVRVRCLRCASDLRAP